MLELRFQRERETKNTVRLEEQVTDAPPVVGTLYLQKYALNRLGNPDLSARHDRGGRRGGYGTPAGTGCDHRRGRLIGRR
jgi:hypothetical protein